MAIYFISDLHLNTATAANFHLFQRFLTEYGQQAEAIYILGDFFHVWIGDDYNPPFLQTIKTLLLDLQQRQVPVFFMRGNRDFLLGAKFFMETNCIELQDPAVVKLDKHKVLLTHGDTLTTNDLNYLRFRYLVNSKIVKLLFLWLPIKTRLTIANWLRSNSRVRYKKQIRKDATIFAVVGSAVQQLAEQQQVSTIIHGHTHSAGQWPFIVNAQSGQRFVLGDWHVTATILVYEQGMFKLLTLP